MLDARVQKLDKKNLYLLSLLDSNCRMPLSEMGAKLRMTKESIHYRIGELEKSGIIDRYYVIIDTAKLGYYSFKLYLQLQRVRGPSIASFAGFLADDPAVYWLAHTIGKFDIIVGLWVQNQMEFDSFLVRLMKKHGAKIAAKQFTITKYGFQTSRKWLFDNQNPSLSIIGGPAFQHSIDALDWKILSLLSTNGRLSYSKIAQECGSTAATVISRVRKLEKSGVITAHRIHLNLEKLGMEFYKLFVVLSDKTETLEKKMIEYCSRHRNVLNVLTCVGPWDMEIEIEAKSLAELNEVTLELRGKWPKNVHSVELVSIVSEKTPVFLPKAK